jgi:hypothetical protein
MGAASSACDSDALCIIPNSITNDIMIEGKMFRFFMLNPPGSLHAIHTGRCFLA